MAYRSEVAIKCEQKPFEMLIEVCKREDFMPDKILKCGECFILHWDWVKWNDWYDEVAAVENALAKIEGRGEIEEGWCYKFLRIGESLDDVEERGCESDYGEIELNYVCRIDIPKGLEEVGV